MPGLDDVTQTFYANVAPYVEALTEAIDVATRFAAANVVAADAVETLTKAMGASAAASSAMAAGMTKVGVAAIADSVALGKLADAVGGVEDKAATAGAGGGLLGMLGLGALGALGLTGAQLLHWAVMLPMEIMSTALPAVIAFTDALAAMYPTVDALYDHFNNLKTATGGLSNALVASGGPLHTLGLNMQAVTKAVQPDVMTIFGSAVQVVAGHMGELSGVAQQASSVLATFATKIVNDLAGQAGTDLNHFLADGVQFMEEWGAVLGNLGHTFVNVFSAMPGVGHVLLGVLLAISDALRAISQNTVVDVFIAIAAAMSAVYRYGGLLFTIFKLIVGTSVITGLQAAGELFVAMAGDIGIAAAAGQILTDTLEAMSAALLGPLGVGMAAIGAILGIWALSNEKVQDSTTALISKVEAMKPTVNNLATGILTLTKALGPAVQAQDQLSQSWRGGSVIATYGTADVNNLRDAIVKLNSQLRSQISALQAMGLSSGSLTASMNVLTIQTGLQDAAVANLNQAWDQYIGLVTGGTSGLAQMATTMQNMLTVTSGSGSDLTTTTETLQQFQAALAQGPMGAQGAAAWTSFDNLLTQTQTGVSDYAQTALTAGAITRGQFSQAILDAAEIMSQYAGSNQLADQQVLAFASRSGQSITTMAQLAQATGGVTSATQGLSSIMAIATGNMASASQIAQNLSSTLSGDETQAIASAALQASGFSTDVANMIKAQQTNSTVGGLTWQQWAQLAQNALTATQTTAGNVMQGIQGTLSKPLPTLKVIVDFIPTGSSIAMQAFSASGGLTSQAIYTQTGQGIVGHSAHGSVIGYQAGGMISGLSGIDANLIAATAGEAILNSRAVAALGGPLGIHSLNNQPSEAVLTGSGGMGGGQAISLNMRVDSVLNGQQVASGYHSAQLVYGRRNPGANLTLGHGRSARPNY